MTTLIIARHGNTFSPGETPRRVGGRTDLPLVTSGIDQGRRIGHYLATNGIEPDLIYSAPLLRTRQTAEAALPGQPIIPLEIFREIDYGPDENATEDQVIDRIGADAIAAWNAGAIVPPDWQVDPAGIIDSWHQFANRADHTGKTILVVTSNGIARFAPHLTGDFPAFAASHSIKLSTGALAILTKEANAWAITEWNLRPSR